MDKMLKQPILLGKRMFWTIQGALESDYERFTTTKSGYGLAKYRNKLLCMDIEDADVNYEGNDSLYSNVEKQIKEIDEMLDGE